MSHLRGSGLVSWLCIGCLVSAAALGANNAVTPKVRTVNSGVGLDVRPVVGGNTARTDINFGVSRVREFRTVNVDLGTGGTVPIQLPLMSIYEVHTSAAVPLVPADIGGNIHAGWIPLGGVDRAVNMAQTHGRPMLFMDKASSSESKDRTMGSVYARYPGFKGFVRVQKKIDDEIENPKVKSALEKAAKMHPDQRTPRISCVDTKGRVLGVIPYGADKDQLKKKAREFADLHVSLTTLDKNLATGDKLARQGRYNTALKVYTHVAKCDPKQKYYPKLVEEKKEKIGASAKARLDKAQELLDKGNRVTAAKLVNPVIQDGGDFDFLSRAKEIKKNCRKL